MTYQARFISFEGLDGSGKTTQLRKLGAYLAAREVPHILTHEPGGTALGGALRRLLKEPTLVYRALNGTFEGNPDFQTLNEDELRTHQAEILLFLASRADFVAKIVQPNLHRGVSVITDRFLDSTAAYQGGGLFKGDASVLSLIDHIHALILDPCGKPSLTFLLDISYGTMLLRAKESDTKLDFIERRGKDYFERVQAEYRSIAVREPQRVVLIDGCKSPDDIFDNDITPHIQRLYDFLL